jgi:hypothetical protein
MDPDLKSILFNVLGGFIVSALTVAAVTARTRLSQYSLKRLLGLSLKDPPRITYGQFASPALSDQSGKQLVHIFPKPPRKGTPSKTGSMSFSISHPVSECEVRATTYLSTLLGSFTKSAILTSDTDASAILDADFLTVGWIGGNYKSADIINSDSNFFLSFTADRFNWKSGADMPYTCGPDADHGVILRVTPDEFPDRAWIICAGLGEWGTSGAAWFLSRKWKDILKRIEKSDFRHRLRRTPDFCAFVRVIPGQDESAKIVDIFIRKANNAKKI